VSPGELLNANASELLDANASEPADRGPEATPPASLPGGGFPPRRERSELAGASSYYVCANCLYGGPAKRKGTGCAMAVLALLTLGVTIVFWPAIFLLLILLVVDQAMQKKICRGCGSEQLVPGRSPRGQQMLGRM